MHWLVAKSSRQISLKWVLRARAPPSRLLNRCIWTDPPSIAGLIISPLSLLSGIWENDTKAHQPVCLSVFRIRDLLLLPFLSRHLYFLCIELCQCNCYFLCIFICCVYFPIERPRVVFCQSSALSLALSLFLFFFALVCVWVCLYSIFGPHVLVRPVSCSVRMKLFPNCFSSPPPRPAPRALSQKAQQQL